MKKLSKEDKKTIDGLLESIGRILIMSMILIDVPNSIDATFIIDETGDEYKLRFEKLKTKQ